VKVYQIPEDHKLKLKEWEKRQHKFDQTFKVIKELTGIEPIAVSERAEFAFKPKNHIDKKDLPEYLKLDHDGLIKPKHSSKKGKELYKKWKEYNFEGISGTDFCHFMFNTLVFEFRFDMEEFGDEKYVTKCEGIDLTKYGYIEKNIKEIKF